MKKDLLLLFLFILFTNFLFADPIDSGLATRIAKNFYLQSVNNQRMQDVTLMLVYTEKSASVSGVNRSSDQDLPLYYVFNVNQNDGFIIVSADDEVTPVLGYSTSGSYSTTNNAPAFQKLLEKYKQEILYVISNGLQADNDISSCWDMLYNGKPLHPSGNSQSVNPLLQTTWNQSPYENGMCPSDPAGPGGHCVTGCPATAMAQIMKYWNYPAKGTGFHSYNSTYGTLSADFGSTTYNWSAMPNHLNAANNATALLMFHAGVSVEMTYGPDGSYGWVIAQDQQGNHPACCENAYKTYFGYSNSMNGSERKYHTDAEWTQMLKTDLDAGRPVQYAGFGSGGHTWVCDGYDNGNYFHMNWGWGSAGDGFYLLDALNPGSNYFNNNQQALFGIQPNQGGTTTLQIYAAVAVTPDPVAFGQGFSVHTDLINSGSTAFAGDYTAALFNDQGTFIDYVQTITGENLPPNYHYTEGLTFTTTGIAGATPGNYTIGIYSRPTGGGWTVVSAGSFTNPINITIAGSSNIIELYSAITIDHNPILVNQAFAATADIVNNGSSTFTGDISLDIHSSNGTWIQSIQEYTGVSLQAGYFFDNVKFSTTGLNVEPGNYYLVVWDKPTGGEWKIVSSGAYSNPIEILISGQPLSADRYESNNSAATAYHLPVVFTGNTVNANTDASNIHNGTDVDFYQVTLPAGFSYSIHARVHDSYNSGNGITYTGDVMFSYKIGDKWSGSYDDVMPSDILLQDGGTLLFDVTPYFPGATGTYLLDMNITRSTGIENSIEKRHLLVYPNPASDLVTFQLDLKQPGNIKGTLINCFGQQQLEFANGTFSAGRCNLKADISKLVPGYYMYQIRTAAGQTTGKLIIVK
jgi:hypothetical protein